MKPLAIDLYCGLGGWTEGLLAEGYEVVGFDIERHNYGTAGGYPAQLVLQDVLTLHGSQFRSAALIVASPPCQEFSKYAMPFGSLWREHSAMDDDGAPPGNYLGKPTINGSLFRACFRIQREASESAGHHIPMVVENVRGAQRWVGRAAWNYGSFYFWGDLPAIMPSGRASKWGGCNGNQHEQGGKGGSFQSAAVKGFAKEWRDSPNGMPMMSSKSPARKAASAQIAKIPFPVSQWIARTYKPRLDSEVRGTDY